MESRQEQNSGTREVRQAHRFDESRLLLYMKQHVAGFAGPLTIRQFKGGQSNPTYRLEAASGNYVLRRKPPGSLLKSAHAVDREFKVISALHAAGFPVPRPFALCADESVIGTMFYIMECVEGRILWELDLPGCDRDERAAVYDNVNKTLADLHNLDYEQIGLADYGKPGNYFARQISRWAKQYELSEIDNIPEMHRLIEWLPGNIPDDDTSGIVHGDYRLDNMVLHPTEPRVIAVLDWELSTIGHPLGDFTYHLMAWQMPNFDIGASGLWQKNLQALGIPTEEEYVRRYCKRTGRDDIENRDFYAAYNFFRIAAILQGIAGRVRDGTAASANAAKSARIVEPLARIGWERAQRAGA